MKRCLTIARCVHYTRRHQCAIRSIFLTLSDWCTILVFALKIELSVRKINLSKPVVKPESELCFGFDFTVGVFCGFSSMLQSPSERDGSGNKMHHCIGLINIEIRNGVDDFSTSETHAAFARNARPVKHYIAMFREINNHFSFSVCGIKRPFS